MLTVCNLPCWVNSQVIFPFFKIVKTPQFLGSLRRSSCISTEDDLWGFYYCSFSIIMVFFKRNIFKIWLKLLWVFALINVNGKIYVRKCFRGYISVLITRPYIHLAIHIHLFQAARWNKGYFMNFILELSLFWKREIWIYLSSLNNFRWNHLNLIIGHKWGERGIF